MHFDYQNNKDKYIEYGLFLSKTVNKYTLLGVYTGTINSKV